MNTFIIDKSYYYHKPICKYLKTMYKKILEGNQIIYFGNN